MLVINTVFEPETMTRTIVSPPDQTALKACVYYTSGPAGGQLQQLSHWSP